MATPGRNGFRPTKPFNVEVHRNGVRSPVAGILVLVAALAMLAPASAQVPLPEAGVAITAEDDDVAVSVEEARRVTLTVENSGTPTGTPLDVPRDVDVTVEGAPDGWTASVAPARVSVAPGESATVTLTVTVSTSAADGDADLTVTARMRPYGGQEPSPVNPEAADSVAVHAQRSDPLTRDILEGLGPWIYIVLLAFLIVLVILARYTFSGRRPAVRLSADTRELHVRPGGKVQFPFRVSNVARRGGSVLLQVSAVEPGWQASLPSSEVSLGASQSLEMALSVKAPPQGSERQHILVSATSVQNPRRPANLDFVAVVKRPK
jgi:hypothetical protein